RKFSRFETQVKELRWINLRVTRISKQNLLFLVTNSTDTQQYVNDSTISIIIKTTIQNQKCDPESSVQSYDPSQTYDQSHYDPSLYSQDPSAHYQYTQQGNPGDPQNDGSSF
ncbi:13847_t:CDS:2, partial [Funneliformis mosseae]